MGQASWTSLSFNHGRHGNTGKDKLLMEAVPFGQFNTPSAKRKRRQTNAFQASYGAWGSKEGASNKEKVGSQKTKKVRK